MWNAEREADNRLEAREEQASRSVLIDLLRAENILTRSDGAGGLTVEVMWRFREGDDIAQLITAAFKQGR